MARHALSPACLTLVQCLEASVPPALRETGLESCRIGLSGGADSLALTAALAWAKDHRRGPLAGVEVSARIVDHGLQAGSDEVAHRAAAQSETLGISAQVVRVDVNATGVGVEAAAREARYTALTQGSEALILLAHTLDDQAETVLLGLARGSGVRSLAGMPQRRGHLLRPFLAVRRWQTEQACKDWGLDYWTDPTNGDPAYARSRLRAAMSTLETTLGPGLAEALARTADLSREDADYLDHLAQQTSIDPGQSHILVEDIAACHPAVRHRVLLAWLRSVGQDAVTRDHVLAVDSLLTDWHGQKGIDVPGGHVVRQGSRLFLEAQCQVSSGQP